VVGERRASAFDGFVKRNVEFAFEAIPSWLTTSVLPIDCSFFCSFRYQKTADAAASAQNT
jgi:hypothetical protein